MPGIYYRHHHPPQNDDSNRYNSNGRKVKALKKGEHLSSDIGKNVEDEADPAASLNGAEVKIAALRGRPESPTDEDGLGLDIDPELQRHRRNRTVVDRLEEGSVPPQQLARFDVDLPEEMQWMLALSPPPVNLL